jgi:hypothetical protein
MRSSSSAALLFLLVLATASRLSLADARGTSITEVMGRELRGLVARADNIFRSAAGWHTTSDEDAAAATFAESKDMRARKPSGGGGARCVTAAMCRKRRVICGKRCYGAAAARTSVNHVPRRCVVKCKKCVATC